MLRLIPLALVSSLGVIVAADFPHRTSDLAVDPAITWGALDNGLRYALMANAQPKDKVTLRLQVRSGSLHESDPQRGLAHYLEHMAFNGTTNYPPGQLVVRLQHLGLQFGAHTNAHTSFDETVYKLDLPDASSSTLAIGLGVMADWAGGMLLQPSEIDRERGVILAEMRDRDDAGRRIWQAVAGAAYAGTRIAERMPIGVEATIKAADQALLKSYFDTWYRPERMILTVVGSITPAAIEPQIRACLLYTSDAADDM
jgi:zinc protease